MDAQPLLAAIAEPARFRIVLLLAAGPRTVGEVAAAVGALQPQTTKHLQALQASGVVQVRRLGRRRLVGLDRSVMTELADWFRDLAEATPDDQVLEDYAAAVSAAQRRVVEGAVETGFTLSRTIDAPPAVVWRAWTAPDVAARWWAPRHFVVTGLVLEPVTGGPVELRIREGDGTEHTSAGRVLAVQPERRLVFELAPVDGAGRALLHAVHEVVLRGTDRTELGLTVRASTTDAGAAPMLAGLEPGWSQLLDGLEAVLTEAG